MIRLAINGALGRMGRRILALAHEDPRFTIVAAIEASDSPHRGAALGPLVGLDIEGVTLTESLTPGADVCLDFTRPDGCVARARECADLGTALITGTTGLSETQHETIRACAERIPLMHAPNFSVGVAVLAALAAQAARSLGPEFDLEIVEMHHRGKVDAPSGTASMLLDTVCAARGDSSRDDSIFGRRGEVGERPPGQVAVHALRGGDVVGEHTLVCAGPGERVEITHRATDRDVFVRGALRATAWLAGRDPGWYRFGAVLGLGADADSQD